MDIDVKRHMCQAINLDGQPCQAGSGPDGWCYFHRPGLVAEAECAAARRFGGRRPSWQEHPQEPCDLGNLQAVRAELEAVVARLKTKDFSPAVANSMIAALRTAAALLVNFELERQVLEFEGFLDERKQALR